MILFYILIFVLPLQSSPLWGEKVGDFTLVKYLGLVCVLYALLYLQVTRRRSPPHYFQTGQAYWLLFFFILASISNFTKGRSMSLAQNNLYFSYISFIVLFFITLTVVDSLQRFRWVLLVATGSIAFASLNLLRQWRWYGYDTSFRPFLNVGNPNDFAAMADLFLPLAFYLLLEHRSWWERKFYAGCLALAVGAITVTASRGGLLGLVVGLSLITLRARRRIRYIPIAGVLLIAWSLSPISPLRRILSPTVSDQESSDSRLGLWRLGLEAIREHPVAGIGLGNFGALVASSNDPSILGNHVAHNTYVELGTEIGLPGLIAFVGILAASFWTLERVRRRTAQVGPALVQQAALGLQAGLLGCSVAIFFSSLEYIKPFWLTVFLTMCLPSLIAKKKSRVSAVETVKPVRSVETVGSPWLLHTD
jgi:O-antigen ligase